METVSPINQKIISLTYVKSKDVIYSIFRQACIPEDICEDLVQEVFLKIMSLDVIVADCLKSLAIKIAYQKRTDYLRHQYYTHQFRKNYGQVMETSYNHHDETETKDILRMEMKVVEQLSDQDCKVYQMSRFEDKTADEIASTLHLSKRAVESRLYRTRILVRNHVKKAIGF